jgi:hypothetical protein
MATEDVSEQLLRAEEIGEQAYQNFMTASIPFGKSSAAFFKPLKKQNLKTFTNMKSTTKIRTPKVDLVLKCDRGVFARMAIIAQIRQLDLREVFSFPLGPLPWALAAPDGSLRKTSKCKLLEALSTETEPPNLQGNSAMIIDGMDLLQKLIHPPTTFGSLAETILSTGILLSPGCQRIDIVFDTYKDTSIKSLEREQRARVVLEERLDNLSAGQRIRNWKGLLSSSKGKKAMLHFLCKEMKDEKYSRKLVQRLIVSFESECFCLTNNGVSSVAELISSQEEADTKILLHAKHAAQEGFEWIILSCQDTDISVIALHFAQQISPSKVVMKRGNRNRVVLQDLTVLSTILGSGICAALPGFHSFTGCDTVSAFAGRGKKVVLKLIQKHSRYANAFSLLGEDWNVPSAVSDILEEFVCRLYGSKINVNKVNECRYALFCAKKGQLESHHLPPCQNALKKHIARANYQTRIWKLSLQPHPDIPSPEGFGWKIVQVNDSTCLEIDWMDCLPAPEAVLELMACTCSTSCTSNCPCVNNGLKCTDMCKLHTCTNYVVTPPADDLEHSSDSDMDTDESDQD